MPQESTNSNVNYRRLNAAKSTGPRTQEGKARSSMNAFKHGRYSRHSVLLREERAEEFQALYQEHIRRFRPKDTIEINLVRQLASVEWRKCRWETLENIILDHETAAQEAELLAAGDQPDPGVSLILGTNSALNNSRILLFIANRISQLNLERDRTLRLIKRNRKDYPPVKSSSQRIDPAPVEAENTPCNEAEPSGRPELDGPEEVQ
jgi:hypothetical protein